MDSIHLETFRFSLYISLCIFLSGMLIRILRWYLINIDPDAENISFFEKISSSIKAFIKTIFSLKLFTVFKVLILDILLQRKILKKDSTRWLMHMFIYGGFFLLLFMHALDEIVSQNLFSSYSATLNPFLFLRNLFALMVVIGISIAVYRRKSNKVLNKTTKYQDKYALIILGIIFISGFLLEAQKILSPKVFHQMVDTYTIDADPDEIEPLRMYWAKEFELYFPDLKDITVFDHEMIVQGREVHENSCMECHSKPEWAFISYLTALSIKSISQKLDEYDAHIWLWYIHFLACFIGLAYLPFSKFLHIFTTPLGLIVNAVGFDEDSKNKPVKMAIEFDSCAHCSACSIHCSVAPALAFIDNEFILPSEKLKFIKKSLTSKDIHNSQKLQTCQEASYICTSCYRCTEICPAGINLQDIWDISKKNIASHGFNDIHSWVRDRKKTGWKSKVSESFTDSGQYIKSKYLNYCKNKDTFLYCMQCQTCSSVCPVVASNQNPSNHLNQTPQRVMNLLRQGLVELAMDVRLVWDCTTCYMCQENCPQGIPVTEILYELKNMSYERQKIRNK